MRLAVALLWYCHLQITSTFGFTVSYSKFSFQFVELRQITFAGVKTKKKASGSRFRNFSVTVKVKIYLYISSYLL